MYKQEMPLVTPHFTVLHWKVISIIWGLQGMHEGSQLFMGMFVLGYISWKSEKRQTTYGFSLPNLFSGQSPAFSRDAMDSPSTGDKK